jgi:hypothetical protein
MCVYVVAIGHDKEGSCCTSSYYQTKSPTSSACFSKCWSSRSRGFRTSSSSSTAYGTQSTWQSTTLKNVHATTSTCSTSSTKQELGPYPTSIATYISSTYGAATSTSSTWYGLICSSGSTSSSRKRSACTSTSSIAFWRWRAAFSVACCYSREGCPRVTKGKHNSRVIKLDPLVLITTFSEPPDWRAG